MKIIWFLLLVSIIAFSWGAYKSSTSRTLVSASEPVSPPPAKPDQPTIGGTGIVEPSSEEILIGTPIAGLVVEVFTAEGDSVRKDDPLFQLDTREIDAELALRESEVELAKAELQRLKELPRPETVVVSKARLKDAETALELARSRELRQRELRATNAVSEDAYDETLAELQQAEARVGLEKAELALVEQGTWVEDIRVAEQNIAVLESRVEQTRINKSRLTIRAPKDGVLLDVRVRPGQFAGADTTGGALMTLGVIDPLFVRVDVDETEGWRFTETTEATVFVRGNSLITSPATFVRFEPRIVPKTTLTGETTERVDVRVLQILYRLTEPGEHFRVGQRVDVFIPAKE